MISREQVQEANIKLHTQLADYYHKIEPGYSPENIERVDKIIKFLTESAQGKSLLDVGCGTGFIIDIAKRYFKIIRGIDITPAMLEKVDINCNSCDIKLQIAEVEKLPFASNSFDVVTAYSVLHHLHDLKPAFKEIYRVLKSGGLFYTDTDPNYYFWEAFHRLTPSDKYSNIINKEIYSVNYKDEEFEQQYSIPKDTVKKAEMLKHLKGGFKEEELKLLLSEEGFSSIDIRYEWFLGEANIIHSAEMNASAEIMRKHLREILPLSRHLFKYIRIIAKNK